MTYSEVVALLSSHMVPNEEGNQVPMLEKFVNMENNFEHREIEELSDHEEEFTRANE
jgi:hypothetical protein